MCVSKQNKNNGKEDPLAAEREKECRKILA
jgi:hypothetical protein